MENNSILIALFLGFLEGLTEFIPVSSTAHLLLVGHLLGFESKEKIFEIIIQLGAIIALPCTYLSQGKEFALRIKKNPTLLTGILVAFFPAAIIGMLAHGFIKLVLFESHNLICIMLISGGIFLLWIDQCSLKPRYFNPWTFPLKTCLKIGLFQCLAIIPGVSRSGSTILGALLSGTDKKSAAEFSFILAIPTIIGAVALDLFKNQETILWEDIPFLASGFLSAFLTALIVVRFLVEYVSKQGYTAFAWWRIIAGTAGIIALKI